MNYERIYNEFIFDRREKEKNLNSKIYTESHHIIPRCMNGGDEKENLIRLIPEDHFFAHLLLAKAYGGKNWMALHSMLHRGIKTEEISYKDFRNRRKSFGFIRRMVANTYKGRNNSQADNNSYLLLHKDGRRIEGDRVYISENTELTSRLIGKLVKGKINTAHNWYYPKFNPEGLTTAEKNLKESEIFTLFHFDGREWTGNKKDFALQFRRPLFFPKEESVCAGWFKNKNYAEEYFQKRINASSLNRRIFEFEIIKTNEKVYHSKATFKKEFNVTEEQITNLIYGKIKKLKGLRVIRQNQSERKLYGQYYKFISIRTNEKYNMTVTEMAKMIGVEPTVVSRLVKGKIKVLKRHGITMA